MTLGIGKIPALAALIWLLALAGCERAADTESVEFFPVGSGDELLEMDIAQARFGRDFLRPIYEPQFVAAADADLEPRDIVMGLEIDGDARAYPVRLLNVREMVDDVVGGVPVLVTW